MAIVHPTTLPSFKHLIATLHMSIQQCEIEIATPSIPPETLVQKLILLQYLGSNLAAKHLILIDGKNALANELQTKLEDVTRIWKIVNDQCINKCLIAIDHCVPKFLENPAISKCDEAENDLRKLKAILIQLRDLQLLSDSQKAQLEQHFNNIDKASLPIDPVNRTLNHTQEGELKRKTRLPEKVDSEEDAISTFPIPELSGMPPEVVFGILKYLDISDLQSVSSVCRLLNGASDDDHLWRLLMQRDFPECAIHTKSSVKQQYVKTFELHSNIAHGRYLEETLPLYNVYARLQVKGNLVFTKEEQEKPVEDKSMEDAWEEDSGFAAMWEISGTNNFKKLPLKFPFQEKIHSYQFDGTYLFVELSINTIQVWKRDDTGDFIFLQELSKAHYHLCDYRFEGGFFIASNNIGGCVIWEKDDKDRFTELKTPDGLNGEEFKFNGELLFESNLERGVFNIWERDEQNNFTLMDISKNFQAPLDLEQVFSFYFSGDLLIFILKENADAKAKSLEIWKKDDKNHFTLLNIPLFQKTDEGPEEDIELLYEILSLGNFLFTCAENGNVRIWKRNNDNFTLLKTLKYSNSVETLQFDCGRLFSSYESEGSHILNFGASYAEMLTGLADAFAKTPDHDHFLKLIDRLNQMPKTHVTSIYKILSELIDEKFITHIGRIQDESLNMALLSATPEDFHQAIMQHLDSLPQDEH